jgi:hypothetical protein
MGYRLMALVLLSAAPGFANSWSGALVDSKCWDSEEGNINRKDTSIYVDRDRNLEVRYCSPKAKTKAFAVVLIDGLNMRLDEAGNAKAAELVQANGKMAPVRVVITGEANHNTIKVDSLSMAK